MKLTWTEPAADDLEELVDYIGRDKPDAAARVAQRIVHRLESLSSFPLTGRKGEVQGTYEVVLTPHPYVAVYRVFDNEMRIMRIRHSAQA